MIHHEPWFQVQAASQEALQAIERLKRGDDEALHDIWKLGERGLLEGVNSDFLVEVMSSRHRGIGFEWIGEVSREWGLYKEPILPPKDKKAWSKVQVALSNVYTDLQIVSNTSQWLSGLSSGPDTRCPTLRDFLIRWNSLDKYEFPSLIKAWEGFLPLTDRFRWRRRFSSPPP